MGRPPCCEEMGLKKGPWTPEEDNILISYIQQHGHGNWRALPKLAGLLRCGKSCRLRWINYLRPDIKRGNFTKDEEDTIIKFHHLLGNRWSAIAARLPGRTDNEIKNFWHTNLKKRSTGAPPPPLTPTITRNVVTNNTLQIIPQQPPEVDAAKTRHNYVLNQPELLLQSCSSSSYDEYQQQQPVIPMMMFPSKNQQFGKLLVESDHHKLDDQNHIIDDDDFWYTLFVKAENPAHHDDQILLT